MSKSAFDGLTTDEAMAVHTLLNFEYYHKLNEKKKKASPSEVPQKRGRPESDAKEEEANGAGSSSTNKGDTEAGKGSKNKRQS